MGVKGQSYQLDFLSGGFQHNPNSDSIPDNSMVDPSRNINLHTGGRKKRGGTQKVFSTPIAGTPEMRALFYFTKSNNVNALVTGTANGKIIKLVNAANVELKSGLTVDSQPWMETFNDVMYFCNGADKVQTWDGVAGATSDLGTPPTDWGTASPKVILKHSRQNSLRLAAIGAPGKENNLYVSDTSGSFADANVTVFRIDSGDPRGLVGLVEFGERLIIFSRNFAFILDDDDLSIANWGYVRTQWTGGAGSQRLIVKTPNDVLVMTADGEVYSISTVTDFGDYKYASLLKPSWLHDWMVENVDFTKLSTDGHGVYDPILRAVKFFVPRLGQTEVDTCIVYFLDRRPGEEWSIHDTEAAGDISGYRASCSTYGPDINNNFFVLTGNYLGNTWKLEQPELRDGASGGYYAGFFTPHLHFGNPRQRKAYRGTQIVARPEGDYYLTIRWIVDGADRGLKTTSLAGIGGIYGSGVFGTAVYGGQSLIQSAFETRAIGTRIQYEIFNQNANEDFFVTRLMCDFKPLGTRPTWDA